MKKYYIELVRNMKAGAFDRGFYKFNCSLLVYSEDGSEFQEYENKERALNQFNEIKRDFKDYLETTDYNYLMNNADYLELKLIEYDNETNEDTEKVIESYRIL